MNKDNSHNLQFDVIREIGNIGAGSAATALSKLLNKKVNMKIPDARMVPFDEIAERVGGSEQVVVAIFLKVSGDVPGNIFFILSMEAANHLLHDVAGLSEKEYTRGFYTEIASSALSEIANILAGSYLTALADFTGLNMSPSVPLLAVDMAGAILTHGILEYGQMGDQALIIDSIFFEGEEIVEGHFFLIPSPRSMSVMMSAMGVNEL